MTKPSRPRDRPQNSRDREFGTIRRSAARSHATWTLPRTSTQPSSASRRRPIAAPRTATNQRGGLVSGGDGIAEAKSQTSAWTCGRNCSSRGNPTDSMHPRATSRFDQGIVGLTRGACHPRDAEKWFPPLPSAFATCVRSSPTHWRFPCAAVHQPASSERSRRGFGCWSWHGPAAGDVRWRAAHAPRRVADALLARTRLHHRRRTAGHSPPH